MFLKCTDTKILQAAARQMELYNKDSEEAKLLTKLYLAAYLGCYTDHYLTHEEAILLFIEPEKLKERSKGLIYKDS